MDFSTINAQISLQQQDARRAIREREYDRIAEKRADAPTITARKRGFVLSTLFSRRVPSAQ
jgi:hypothetical protein